MGTSENQFSKKNRRRRYLIDKPLQLKYTSFIVVLIIMYSACLGYALYSNSRSTSHILLEFVENNPKLISKLNNVDTNLLIKTIIAMIINTLVIAWISIFSTHKVAGPIYRFRKHLSSIKSGDFSFRTNLRKNDMLADLADEFNQASEHLKRFIENDITETERFSEKINKLNEAIKKNQIDLDDATLALDDIHNDIEQFAKHKKNLIGL